MAVLTDSFDGYNGTGATTGVQSRWNLTIPAAFSLVAGRFSGQALSWASAATAPSARLPLGGLYSSLSIGFALYWVNMPTENTTGVHFRFDDATAAPQCGLRVNIDGSFTVRRMTGNILGTDLYTSPAGIFTPGVWHYLEMEVVIDDAAGSFKVYVNGEQLANLTGVDTKAQTTSTVSSFLFGQTQSSVNTLGQAYMDDLAFNDSATKIGEARIDVLRPSADDTVTWTPDTGSVNYSRVNETLIDTANYLSTNVVGNRDLYEFDDLSVTPTTIYAVTVICFARKTDATTRVLQNTIQSNGVDAMGSNHYLGTSDEPHATTYLLNPDGDVAWTKSAVDALLAGPKLAA